MKIKTRLTGASIAILLLLILSGVGFWLILANQRGVLDDMSVRNRNEQTCNIFAARLVNVHQNIYKAINWATMGGYSDERISQLLNRLVEENDQVRADLVLFSESADIDETESGMVMQVIKEHDVYSGWLMQVVNMCSIDPATSSMMMGSAESAYQQMRSTLDELAGYARQKSAETRLHADRFRKTLTITFILVLAAVTLAVCLVLANLIQSIIPPLRRLADLVKDISEGQGDLTKRLEVSGGDEIGEVATYFNQFVGKLQQMVSSISTAAGNVASSATELSAVSAQSAQSANTVSERISMVAASAEEYSVNTSSVATSMEQTSVNLSSVAGATQEMSATICEIASNSEKARNISADATGQVVSLTSLMQRLGEAAQQIGKVTETITDISSQTNLLALNATIEAARAGAAGKGFAVVANEIKELAKQTSDATEDIKDKISGVQNSAGSAIADIEKITGIIAEVGHIVSNIATAIEQQSTVTRDVASNIARASTNVSDANDRVSQTASVSKSIAHDISGIDAAAGEIRSSGDQVQQSSAELSKLAEQLRSLVGQFRV